MRITNAKKKTQQIREDECSSFDSSMDTRLCPLNYNAPPACSLRVHMVSSENKGKWGLEQLHIKDEEC